MGLLPRPALLSAALWMLAAFPAVGVAQTAESDTGLRGSLASEDVVVDSGAGEPGAAADEAETAGSNDSEDEVVTSRPVDNANRDAAEDDPFAPLGIRSGGMTYFPKVELRGGITDNGARAATGRSARYYLVSPELVGRSDWSRHSLEFTLRGTYRDYVTGNVESEPSFDAGVKSRLDLGATTSLDLRGDYSLTRETSWDPDVAGVVDRPMIHTLTGSLGLARQIGAFEVRPLASVSRTIYERSGTGPSRNSTLLEGGLRVSRSGGMVQPFVEAIALRRAYDDAIDGNGQRRAATGGELRGGLVFDIEEVLAGEVSLGYRRERLREAALADIEGWTLAGDVTWTVSALTKANFSARTDFNPSTVVGTSGSVRHQLAVRLTHELRRNLVFDLDLLAAREEYTGLERTDETYSASLTATYKLNRSAALTARASHERLKTTVPGEDYTANSFEVGLTLQR